MKQFSNVAMNDGEVNMQERRRYVRWSVTSPLRYKIQGSNLESMGLTKDISMGGIGAFILEELPQGSILDLILEIPDELRPIKTEGKLIWKKQIQREKREQFITGVFFTRLKDEDKEKIYRYVRENLSNEITKRWWQGLK